MIAKIALFTRAFLKRRDPISSVFKEFLGRSCFFEEKRIAIFAHIKDAKIHSELYARSGVREGGKPRLLFEEARKIMYTGKAEPLGDLANVQIGLIQKTLGLLGLHTEKELYNATARFFVAKAL